MIGKEPPDQVAWWWPQDTVVPILLGPNALRGNMGYQACDVTVSSLACPPTPPLPCPFVRSPWSGFWWHSAVREAGEPGTASPGGERQLACAHVESESGSQGLWRGRGRPAAGGAGPPRQGRGVRTSGGWVWGEARAPLWSRNRLSLSPVLLFTVHRSTSGRSGHLQALVSSSLK